MRFNFHDKSMWVKVIIAIIVLALVGVRLMERTMALEQVPMHHKPVVKIGALYPLSGENADRGETAKKTASLFFESFNNKAHQFDYQIIFEDTQMRLDRTAMAAQKLVEIDRVDSLISIYSSEASVVAPLAKQNNIFHISINLDAQYVDGERNFLIMGDMTEQAMVLHDRLVKEGVKKVSVVVVNAAGQLNMIDHFKKVAKQEDKISVLEVYPINPTERDFKLMLVKIKNDNPDYIIAQMFSPTLDIFMKQYREARVSVPITGVDTFTNLKEKRLAEGFWYVAFPSASTNFLEEYQEKYNVKPGPYAEYMYATLQVLTSAYETGGKKDIGSFLRTKTDGMETKIGKIHYYGKGIMGGKPIIRKIVDGKPVVVEE